jgi:transcriptional regulator with XRE-family HTH domain
VSQPPPRADLAALGAFVRARRLAAHLSLRELATRAGVSNAYLSQVERGVHEPSLSVLRAIAAALEVPLTALLVEASALPGPSDAELDTEAAILRDPALSEAQRLALLTIYRSFVPPRS